MEKNKKYQGHPSTTKNNSGWACKPYAKVPKRNQYC
jgi:hypothetical protein